LWNSTIPGGNKYVKLPEMAQNAIPKIRKYRLKKAILLSSN
jgi:hypothetical protein